nr:hypothetical protein pmam_108 [Pithovirus mammoth]
MGKFYPNPKVVKDNLKIKLSLRLYQDYKILYDVTKK